MSHTDEYKINFQFLEQPVKISEQRWEADVRPFVSISCITYNHEKYIKDAFEGFLMQETTFPVEILVHDDASTDSTSDIIREYESKYPAIFKVIYQTENQYSKKVKIGFTYQYPRVRGKYYATCEGDDYWIDPLKLQKQVNFIEKTPSCSMVFTGCIIKKSNGERKIVQYNDLKIIDVDKYLESSFFMATAGLLFHRRFINAPKEGWMDKAFAGDFILRYRALAIGVIGYINDITCIYNKGGEGSWSSRKLNKKLILKEYSDNVRGLYYINKYKKVDERIKDRKIAELRKLVYFKMALKVGGIRGLCYLMVNLPNTTIFHIGAYLKRLVK